MITINAISFDNNELKVQNIKELETLYNTIMQEESFILTWNDKTIKKSEVIFASNFVGKIKTGEIKLTSEENTFNKKI